TQYLYDALGRMADLTRQDGNTVHTDYSGNTTTVTDETGRKRRSSADALGRVIRVDEADAPFAGTQAYGTLTLGGLQSVQVQTQAPTHGFGRVQIDGSTDYTCLDADCVRRQYDTGSVSITVGNFPPKSTIYNSGTTDLSIAQDLANQFNA